MAGEEAEFHEVEVELCKLQHSQLNSRLEYTLEQRSGTEGKSDENQFPQVPWTMDDPPPKRALSGTRSTK